MPDEKLPIILHPGSGLALVKPQGGRIVAEMVNGALALSRTVEVTSAALAATTKPSLAIQDRTARTHYDVYALFETNRGSGERYIGRWRDETLAADRSDSANKCDRVFIQTEAEAIADRCNGKPAKVRQTVAQCSEPPPLPFDLTDLQISANKIYGLTTDVTLEVATALYQELRVITNPLTNAKNLQEGHVALADKALRSFTGTQNRWPGRFIEGLRQFSETAMAEGYLRKDNPVFDWIPTNEQIAIIPTGQIPSRNLTELEEHIYYLISCRFIASLFPAAEFEVTHRMMRLKEDVFISEQKLVTDPGWLAVHGKLAGQVIPLDRPSLHHTQMSSCAKKFAPLRNGEVVSTLDVEWVISQD